MAPDSISLEKRVAGCLFGGALGDAIGGQFEGRSGRQGFVVGEQLFVSDDTQLTLATCEAIVANKGKVAPESIAERFTVWFRERRLRGLGASTLKALFELDAGGHWADVGAIGERAAGNGAAMRIAPLAFFLDPYIEFDCRTIRDVCRITHRHDEAYLGALVLLRFLCAAIRGYPLDWSNLLDLTATIPDSKIRDRLNVVLESQLSVAQYAERFGASGYVVDSVPLAILAAIRACDFLGSVRELVSLGGDTDTIASMFGQVFGAAFGPMQLPLELLDRIDETQSIKDASKNLSQALSDCGQ